MIAPYKSVSVVMTVKNESDGCALTLKSLSHQTRAPDEVIVVDGGSTDATLQVIHSFEASNLRVRLIEAPGANIARGRNIGTEAATCEIIAATDSGNGEAETRAAERVFRMCRRFPIYSGM